MECTASLQVKGKMWFCPTFILICQCLGFHFHFVFPVQDEFMVVDGKAKTKGRERRVFLFEKIIIFSEPMTREGGLPEFRYMHSMKVNIYNSKWLSEVLSMFLLVEACK